jgi:hypothetical protein
MTALIGVSAVTSKHDGDHCICMRTAIDLILKMDDATDWAVSAEEIIGTSVVNTFGPAIHFREQQLERRSHQSSTPTFDAPTIPVGLRPPLTAAPSLPFEGQSRHKEGDDS